METLNGKKYIEKARLAAAGKDVRKLAAIHAGVTVGLGLLITLLQYVLAKGIGNTSGLSGMNTRSILETMQTVLQWANTLLVPFWNLGFLYTALQWSRGNSAQTKDLLAGFQRIGPCVGLLLNRFMISFAVMFLCAYLCGGAFMMMPAAEPLLEVAYSANGDMEAFYGAIEQMDPMMLMSALAPILILWGIVCLALLVPLLYRFRFAEFVILNHPGVRGLPAMMISAALLRRRCWQLFKLDLRMWWYYGLQLLCVLVMYANLLLGAVIPVGELPVLLLYLLYLAGLFLVQTFFLPRVETAYALFYDKLMEMGPVQKKTAPAVPANVPWDNQ